jgi:histidinol dehydrogenase
MANQYLLKQIDSKDLEPMMQSTLDQSTLDKTRQIVNNVRDEGEEAVRAYATQFNERNQFEPLVLGRPEMQAALDSLDTNDRALLERVAQRIRNFAIAQRNSLTDLHVEIPGGYAGHTVDPVESAGCYAPAGRYPLPSSVLMTAIAARVAGCERVVVASPGANPIMLAAAAIADADEFLAVGGAHAVSAMTHGFEGDESFRRCDVVVGPGNKWVTAAKQLVTGLVGIDMLAGPSELLILADSSANPKVVAADLIAQAEHDTDAVAMLIATDQSLINEVIDAIEEQLGELPTADVARQALCNGFVICEPDIEKCISISDTIAPEHLEIIMADCEAVASKIKNAGAVFIGERSAEVFGDYGAGPNHTLPTGGTARFQAGLSVMQFLRVRTWLKLDSFESEDMLLKDTQRLAQLEGLAGHEKAAIMRSQMC